MNGFLNINKPAGWTSHDVVAKVRRLLGARKVGHTGTLDPSATGVLPICIGKATKVAQLFLEMDKEYRVVMRLGEQTDTQDATGTIVKRKPVGSLTHEEIGKTVAGFQGPLLQIVPMYSAVKVGGEPLYKAARQKRQIECPSRPVVIYRITVLWIDNRPPDIEGSHQPALGGLPGAAASQASGSAGDWPGRGGIGSEASRPPHHNGPGGIGGATAPHGPPDIIDVTFDVTCSKGTYVRTLCADMGERLGVGGHLLRLERRRSGPFRIEEAIRLEEIQQRAAEGSTQEKLIPIQKALSSYSSLRVTPQASCRVVHGGSIGIHEMASSPNNFRIGETVLVYNASDELVALASALMGSDRMRDQMTAPIFKIDRVLV